MTIPQNTYNDGPDAGILGGIYSHGYPRKMTHRRCSEDLPYGRFVAEDGDDGAVLPSADLVKILGVIAATQAIESTKDGSAPHYKSGEVANVMKEGILWVWCETAFASSDVLYIRQVANGSGKYPGQVRN